MRCGAWVLALGLFPAVVTARAATHRVPSDYATINHALEASASGDTVLVAPGTYSDWENRPGPGAGFSAAAFLVDGVTLRSEGGSAVTILDMQGEGLGSASTIQARDLPSDGTTIEGFTIRGVHYPDSAILAVNCGKVTVRDCRIFDVGIQVPGTGAGALRSRDTDIEVVDCWFENCSGSGGAGISQLAGDVVVSDCAFLYCNERAVNLNGDPGLFYAAEFRDCVFLGNRASQGGGGAALWISDYGIGVTVDGCRFQDNASTGMFGSGGAVSIYDRSRPVVFTNNVLLNNWLEGFGTGGTLKVGLQSGAVSITRNTFYGSYSENAFGGSTIDLVGDIDVDFSNNVIAGGTSGQAAVVIQDVNMTSSCNVFWNNENAHTEGFPLSETDRVVDPEFCNAEAGDLTVSQTSPCLPANSLGCGLIGALGQGCGTVSIAPRSWGQVKSMYR